MQLVDSHCHLDCLDLSKSDLPDSLAEVFDLAKQHQVGTMLCVSINLEEYPKVRAISEAHDFVYGSVGLHPTEQGGHEPSVDELVHEAGNPKIIAIGETGLDYYWHKDKPDWQRARFERHIEAGKKSKKPLIVHTRDAKEDTINIMKAMQADSGVMHCFTEDYAMAKQAIDLGFYISFSGIVTFKNAQTLQEVAKKIPLDRLLIETDAPYLAPMPYRGKTNQPAYVRHVAEYIAHLRNESLEKIAAVTTDNFKRLFSLKVLSSM